MTTPSGLLAWGQAGQYNAVDDRAVITALANTRNGVVKPAAITAGTGLAVNIAGGWLAVANCGDSTSAVIGNRTTMTVQVPAGPATGTLTSYIWADVQPDAATFSISVITPAQAAGRSGVQLGTVVAGAGQNLASQMTLTAMAASFGNFDGLIINTAATGGTAYLTATKSGMLYVQSRNPPAAAGTVVTSLQDGAHRSAASASDAVTVSAKWSIPTADMVAFSHYKLWTGGPAKTANPAAPFWFDVNVWGGNFARVNFAANVFPAGTAFNWWLEAHLQLDGNAVNAFLAVKVDITSATIAGTSYSGVATVQFPVPAAGSYMHVRSNLGQLAGPGTAETFSNIFQRFGGADPSGQIIP